jgi:hypothetical protein
MKCTSADALGGAGGCFGSTDSFPRILSVATFECRLNLPYTGADRAFFEPSKVDIKMAVQQFGVTVGGWGLGRRAGLEGWDYGRRRGGCGQGVGGEGIMR